MQLAVIVAIVFAIASVAFAMQNSVPATVVFFVWRFDGSLAMIVLLALALGALIVAVVSTPTTLRSNWVIKSQRKEIDGLKMENAELRARAAEQERRSVSGRSGAAPALGHEAEP
ncbi:MAG: lipopolysaccharide assembly protein LapA domain-containing protein [Pseudomonadota bacterium]